ncbi:regulator of G protein signaling domain-containing protein [Cantharellus anzutake]|uniref:regulator of G protein signaling domain-containing protein n=1 Tax=Cantharellus anzutake TaxID=1750568 RepID=UPI001904582D|nr:regulator of G protein signaling domain-containing protein [Cantharellus anzutake]KAF8338973.1 regulator of G protein signaling domain-containing protein [Cantharellus anzutake]
MSVLDPADDGAASSSHMMRMTRKGRPFLKDTHDLFATLIISLELKTHKQFFRFYHNSFTTDECCANLSQLKFSQSNRGPDPKNPSRVITTTTTTTFSMTRDMAKSMAQNFLDSGLIENAADRQSNTFKDRGIYVITPKGLHVLERFINKNGVSSENLRNVFVTQHVCMRLLHLERKVDDDIVMSNQLLTAVFRRFAGRLPNYFHNTTDDPLDPAKEYHLRADGIRLSEYQERHSQMIGRGQVQLHKHCFGAVEALEWLIDFTCITGRDEAAELAAQFMRYRWIDLVSDKRKNNDQAIIFSVRGESTNGALEEADYRCTPKAIYQITEEGARIARWKENQALALPDGSGSLNRLSSGSSENVHETQTNNDRAIHRRISIAERLRGEYLTNENQQSSGAATGAAGGNNGNGAPRHSNADRLRHILAEPALRNLFRDFLKQNFSEENLSFYLDVQDFKRRFQTTSSANAVNSHTSRPSSANAAGSGTGANGNGNGASNGSSGGQQNRPGQAAMQKHHRDLISMTFVIYNTYLAPGSPCELNIDHTLRNELLHYLTDVLKNTTGKQLSGKVDPEDAETLNATQLSAMIKLYERIQTNVFRLMAMDSVPKFVKTPRFLALRTWVEEYDALEQQEFSVSGPGGASFDGAGAGDAGGGKFRGPPPGLSPLDMAKASAYMTTSSVSVGPVATAPTGSTTTTTSTSGSEPKPKVSSAFPFTDQSQPVSATYVTTSPKANEKFREMVQNQHIASQMKEKNLSEPNLSGAGAGTGAGAGGGTGENAGNMFMVLKVGGDQSASKVGVGEGVKK